MIGATLREIGWNLRHAPPLVRAGLVAAWVAVLAGLALAAHGCAGAQRGASEPWDVQALAGIHGASHGVALVDSGAALYYQQRTDAIAADGGADGAPLRGLPYIQATADLDAKYSSLVRGLLGSRTSLLLAETTVRQARAVGDAPSRCRAGLALADAVTDLASLDRLGQQLGLDSAAEVIAGARTLGQAATPLLQACADDGGAPQ